jgi:hypothetical protein
VELSDPADLSKKPGVTKATNIDVTTKAESEEEEEESKNIKDLEKLMSEMSIKNLTA